MSKTANRIVSLLLALVMALSCVTFVAADAKTVNQVATEIEALSANANDYTAADKAAVEALKADYDALSADEWRPSRPITTPSAPTTRPR